MKIVKPAASSGDKALLPLPLGGADPLPGQHEGAGGPAAHGVRTVLAEDEDQAEEHQQHDVAGHDVGEESDHENDGADEVPHDLDRGEDDEHEWRDAGHRHDVAPIVAVRYEGDDQEGGRGQYQRGNDVAREVGTEGENGDEADEVEEPDEEELDREVEKAKNVPSMTASKTIESDIEEKDEEEFREEDFPEEE